MARPVVRFGLTGRDPDAYVSVDDVEASLTRAEELGGTRLFGPATAPSGLVVGHFADPVGHLAGLAAVPG